MYWNIERIRLLDLRRPVQSEIRSLEMYFNKNTDRMIDIKYEENGEKWILGVRGYRVYISLSQLLERLSSLGAEPDDLAIINTAHTITRPRELDFLFYANEVLLSDAPEDDTGVEAFVGELSVAMKRYHVLRKEIVPIKNALSKATSYCNQTELHLKQRYMRTPPLCTEWRSGLNLLKFGMKSYFLSVVQKQEWMTAQGLSAQNLTKWHKYRRWSRSGVRYKGLQYWKNGVECKKHWYKGSYFQ